MVRAMFFKSMFRDRIQAFRRVKASELAPHPQNWRRHPQRQRAALAAAIQEIGFAGAVLARETDDGGLELIDGHLRTDLAGDAEIPVLVLDVDEAEAAKLLATFDPLTSLADIDYAALETLADDLTFEDTVLKKMVDRLCDAAPDEDGAAEQTPLGEQFQLVIQCRDEDEQRDLFEEMTGRNLKCRVVML